MATFAVGAGQQFLTINAAVNSGLVSTNDTILVHDGEYFELVSIPQAKEGMTIMANPGDSPYITGKVDIAGYTAPYGGEKPTDALPKDPAPWVTSSTLPDGRTPYKAYKHASLVHIQAAGTTWDGINVIRSTGRCITAGVDSVSNNKDSITIKNTELSNCRGQALALLFCDDVIIQNVISDYSVSYYYGVGIGEGSNHPGGIAFKGCDGILVENTVITRCSGESIMVDANWWSSKNAIFRGVTVGDSKRAAFYVHSTHDVLIEDCISYVSADQDIALEPTPFVVRAIEHSSALKDTAYCGVKNLTIRNCLFIDSPSGNINLSELDKICVSSGAQSWIDTVKIQGCTFIQKNVGEHFRDWGGHWKNFTIEGNIFWTNQGHPMSKGAFDPAKKLNIVFKDNLHSNTPTSFMSGDGDIINTDPEMVNPSAVILTGVGPDVDNYKLKSTSPARNGWTPTIIDDYWGNARGAVSDFGFHDYDATGTTLPTDEDPIADFTMEILGVDVTRVAVDVAIDLIDDSTPGSGFTLTAWEWEITLPGASDEDASYSTQDAEHTFTKAGTYNVVLIVTQSNSAESQKIRTIIVEEDVAVDPPDPQVGDCQLANWQRSIRSGTPLFNTEDDGRSIICNTGDQGLWYSYWSGVVVPAEELTVSLDYITTNFSGTGTVYTIYYNSSGAIIDSDSHSLVAAPAGDSESWNVTVPANTEKIRYDVRLWDGTGTLKFSVPCITSVSNLSSPVADIYAEVDSVEISSGSEIEPLVDVDFVATGSTGDSLTYLWQAYKITGEVWVEYGDPRTTSAETYNFDSGGDYQVALEVTQSDGQTNIATFFLTVVVEAPQVSYTKIRLGNTQDIMHPVTGTRPLTVLFQREIINGDSINWENTVWEVLDEDTDVVKTIEGIDDLTLTFPIEETPDELIYGMRVAIYSSGGTVATYVEYGSIIVQESGDSIIGPPTPATCGPDTNNAIHQDGSHTHKLMTDWLGAAGHIPVIDSAGYLRVQNLVSGYPSGILPHTLYDYAVYLVDGIHFFDEGRMTAEKIILDSERVVAMLPTTDPGIANALWNDSGTVKISDGIDRSSGVGEDPPVIIENYVQSGSDDGVETSDTSVTLVAGVMKLDTTYLRTAYRFTSVAIPVGATINSVQIDVYVHYNLGLECYMDVGVEAIANSPALTTTNGDLSGRAISTQKSNYGETVAYGWNSFAIPIAALQAVVDLGGWASGNAVTVLMDKDTGASFAVNSYDLSSSYAAKLRIEYET